MNRTTWLIATLVIVLTMSALVEGLYYWRGLASTPSATALADALSGFLISLWVVADSRKYPQVRRPFDYGYLVLTFCVPYLPYYLWRTRGAVGMVLFAGLVGLFALGFFVQLTLYGLYNLRF